MARTRMMVDQSERDRRKLAKLAQGATTMTAGEFAYAASQWGSYMSAGDPGACMYGFDDSGHVQSEEHRQACIDWINNHCRSAADMNDDPESDHRRLDDMLAYLRPAPIG